MSNLTGYAISTGIFGTDHTYVTSDTPKFAWSCWGRSAGGKVICHGNGGFSNAMCISLPFFTADIIYGVTGVCHQTANRILYPADVIVSKAGGYWISSFLYGTYGTSFIPFFAKAILCKLAKKAARNDSRAESYSGTDSEKEYIKRILDLYSDIQIPQGLNNKIMMQEIYSFLEQEARFMLDFRLNGNVDNQIIDSVLKQQREFLDLKRMYDDSLFSIDNYIETYVEKMNYLANSVLKNLQKSLGEDKFKQIFDLSMTGEQFILIDPDIAKNSFKPCSVTRG